ncbi:MAG: hypothetical protein P4L55_01710 [Syntrophobacteraceae bacterium]|nr:hypothetical protein [Syntrophobacteraceae bacterium]
MFRLVQELRKKLPFLLSGHIAGTTTAPVAVVKLLKRSEFLSQLDHY